MTKGEYRPEIDGLRALAVLAVLVFHLDPERLPGGFVGVDVFFVISGYLITSIIQRQIEQHRFSLLGFYQRRIARLFPALLAMAVVTMIAAKLLYLKWDYANAGGSFSAALLSIANFHLLKQGDYFELNVDAQPLLHCWSLAVEEQFYALFPLLLWYVLKAPRNWRTRILFALATLSFVSGLALTYSHKEWAFYMFPTRAWELLAGGILAMRQRSAVLPTNNALFWLGVFCIGLSFIALRDGVAFPGWRALLPVIGATLILQHGASETGIRVLGSHPMTAIGRGSYSLYLWHWPIFTLVDYTLIFESLGLRTSLKLGLTAIASLASYLLIERPCRKALNRAQARRWAYVFLFGTMVSLGPLGEVIRRAHYIDASDGRQGHRIFDQPASQGTVVLMGDSHATMYGAIMRTIAEEMNLRLVVLSRAGKNTLAPANDGKPTELWLEGLATIRSERPDYVVIACQWKSKLQGSSARLEATLATLKPHVGSIILCAMPPELPSSGHRSAIRDGARAPFLEEIEAKAKRRFYNSLVESAAGEGVQVFDAASHFLTQAGAVMVFDDARKRMFYDKAHVSALGAEKLKAGFKAMMLPN